MRKRNTNPSQKPPEPEISSATPSSSDGADVKSDGREIDFPHTSDVDLGVKMVKISTGIKPDPSPDLDEGDAVEVTIGQETFGPVRYHTFTVGPVTVRVTVRSGESGRDAYVRAASTARTMWQVEFEQKLREFPRHREQTGPS